MVWFSCGAFGRKNLGNGVAGVGDKVTDTMSDAWTISVNTKPFLYWVV